MDDFLLSKGLVPDFMVRRGIRQRLEKKLRVEAKGGPSASERRIVELVDKLKEGPIAVHTDKANQQHYELPPAFFERVLGKHLKYSSGFWREGVEDIHISEADMLELTAWRADIQDGHRILDLGCGWGSFSLFAARKFPNSSILAVSNSATQRAYIEQQAHERNISNLRVVTRDVNDFSSDETFDRIVSIEMFEHMRNYEKLLEKLAHVLTPDGKLFIHIFCHKHFAYLYEENDPKDWIAKYFFTGGVMPSEELLLYFDRHFKIEQRWKVAGSHYQRTCRTWLDRMDAQKEPILKIFRETYGKDAKKWWSYWRVFFMACEELFGYKDGQEWFVGHYLFRKK